MIDRLGRGADQKTGFSKRVFDATKRLFRKDPLASLKKMPAYKKLPDAQKQIVDEILESNNKTAKNLILSHREAFFKKTAVEMQLLFNLCQLNNTLLNGKIEEFPSEWLGMKEGEIKENGRNTVLKSCEQSESILLKHLVNNHPLIIEWLDASELNCKKEICENGNENITLSIQRNPALWLAMDTASMQNMRELYEDNNENISGSLKRHEKKWLELPISIRSNFSDALKSVTQE
ncbi:MAG: hypothetical protein AAF621_03345, partial [Pseudomonadota bacterium]